MRWAPAIICLFCCAAALADSEELRPTSTRSVTNSTCTTSNAHTQLDEDFTDATDGDGLTCLETASTCGTNSMAEHQIQMALGDPSQPLTDGADLQDFRVIAKLCATGGNAPFFGVDVYELTTLQLDDDTGSCGDNWAIGGTTWNANIVTVDNDVEVGLDASASGGSPSGRRTCVYDAMEWVATIDTPPAGRSRRVFEIGGQLVSVPRSSRVEIVGKGPSVPAWAYYQAKQDGYAERLLDWMRGHSFGPREVRLPRWALRSYMTERWW